MARCADAAQIREGRSGDAKDTLLIYGYMFDSVEGAVDHFTQRANLAVVKSPIENAPGGPLPMMNVFVRRNGKVHHSYATELRFIPPDKGQNQRHIDMMWPLWNMLDLTPEGRGDFFPSLDYSG